MKSSAQIEDFHLWINQGYVQIKMPPHVLWRGICDLGRIQTFNRLIRSQLLYSIELRGHISYKYIYP